jgi:hypothetical protein
MTWYRDSWRHALSARGIANRRYSFAYDPYALQHYGYGKYPGITNDIIKMEPLGLRRIKNSTKGNFTSQFDPKYINKRGRVVDMKKSMQGMGFSTTGNKREYGKVGDQYIPKNSAPLFGPSGEVIPISTGLSDFSEEDLTGISNVPMEGTMPTVPSSYGFGTASPTVEGGPPIKEVSTTLPGSQLAGAVIPELIEGKEVSKEGLVEVPGIGTTDAFEPSPLDEEMH